MYCISIWQTCTPVKFESLEHMHARAARLIFKLPKETSDLKSLELANGCPLSICIIEGWQC